MSRYRLRVELPDLPGTLAKVATGRLALAREAPLVQRSHDLPEAFGGRPASTMWLLAVPDGQPRTLCIAFLVRSGSLRFTASEVARVHALMKLHRTLADAGARREHPAASAPRRSHPLAPS